MTRKKSIEKFLKQVEKETDIGFSISENGGNAKEHGYVIEGEYWSDLGEDVLITLVVDHADIDEIVNAMYDYAEGFDAEDHATELYNLHGAYGTPTSLRALLEDADEQQEVLDNIFEVMRKLRDNLELK